MAIDLMARIWRRPKQELDASEKWVLTVMADRADDEGVLWYAIETIADLTSYSPRGVQKIMDRLIAKALVKKMLRRDQSNYYIIALDKFPYIERKSRPKEKGQREKLLAELDAEPDLFGTGERRSGVTGEPGSATGERRSATPERGSPDSLNDSLIDSPTDAHAREGGEAIEELILRSWNELAGKHEALPPVRFLSDARKTLIAQRTDEWAKQDRGDGWPWTARGLWEQAMREIGGSKLLTGQKTAWAPSLDWVLKKSNFAKIIGGNYGHGHDKIGALPAGGNGRSAVAAVRAARQLTNSARQRAGSAPRRSGARR